MTKMADEHSFRDLAHWATHRVPGVPPHAERPTGHHGATHHGQPWQHTTAGHRARNGRGNHSPARPPRVLAAWQRRIAAFFGQES